MRKKLFITFSLPEGEDHSSKEWWIEEPFKSIKKLNFFGTQAKTYIGLIFFKPHHSCQNSNLNKKNTFFPSIFNAPELGNPTKLSEIYAQNEFEQTSVVNIP
jgi:hypothetical protein